MDGTNDFLGSGYVLIPYSPPERLDCRLNSRKPYDQNRKRRRGNIQAQSKPNLNGGNANSNDEAQDYHSDEEIARPTVRSNNPVASMNKETD